MTAEVEGMDMYGWLCVVCVLKGLQVIPNVYGMI